ncbi:hypothetical protein CROQUDRAFT_460305 [Cronartium quercuum f. sp. fusiforme G11]|uniref:Uncharacterized protein n=1 Tax=Cronartium quercuum f. sp. fusiforme G11 TaxID=708437 RepID=A0A9P6NL71_9BASI|nr:hypothetical protein CROQUDRAFT_460305 [Cronartium quercuum f. sp. fusiforme G11]
MCLMLSSLSSPNGKLLFKGKELNMLMKTLTDIPGLANQSQTTQECAESTASAQKNVTTIKTTLKENSSAINLSNTQKIVQIVQEIKKILKKSGAMEECDEECCF